MKKPSPTAEEPRSLRERVREATRQALLEAAEQATRSDAGDSLCHIG